MKPYPSRSRFIASVVSWFTLGIKLGNRLVGTITNVVTDKNIFAFNTQYVEDENRPVLSLSYYDIERQLIARPREGISPEQAFPLPWLVRADVPRAVIAEDSEGQALPPAKEKSEHAKRIKTRFCVFLSPGCNSNFSRSAKEGSNRAFRRRSGTASGS